jgi:hypothetical protein
VILLPGLHFTGEETILFFMARQHVLIAPDLDPGD